MIVLHEFWWHSDFVYAPKQLLLFTHVLLERTQLKKQSSIHHAWNVSFFVDLRQEICFSVPMGPIRSGFSDKVKLLKFPSSSQAFCFTMKRFRSLIRVKNSPFISPGLFFLLEHFPCQLVTQMQICMCQSSPGRIGVTGHGPRQLLTEEECPGQHTEQVSYFHAYMCCTPVRADDLPTQVN